MNLPNLITTSRVPLPFLIGLLLFYPFAYSGVVIILIFLIGIATDILDGYLARKNQEITTFGIFMDPLLDKLFILGTFSGLLIMTDLLNPILYFIFLFTFLVEFANNGVRLITREKGGHILPSKNWGKLKMIFQCLGIFLFLIAYCLKKDLGAKPELFTPFITIGTLLLIASLMRFIYSTKDIFRLIKDEQ